MAEVGWMYRFKDGPYSAGVYGPIACAPPELVVVTESDGKVSLADATSLEHPELASRWLGTVYRRVKMSKLTDEQLAQAPPALVRGAEYEVLDGE